MSLARQVDRCRQHHPIRPRQAQPPDLTTQHRDLMTLDLSANALVLCFDEKSRRCRRWTAARDPAGHADHPARMTDDYVRHGTTSLFVALDVVSGSVIAELGDARCVTASTPGYVSVTTGNRRTGGS